MKELNNVLSVLGAIKYVEVNTSYSPYPVFRCTDQVSLGLITSSIHEKSSSWKIEVVPSEDDARIPWYHIIPTNPNGQENYSTLLDAINEAAKNRFAAESEEYDSSGVPDLSLVTVAQMFKELNNRDIDAVCAWHNNGQINIHAYGPTIILLGMIKKMEHYLLAGNDD